MKDRSTTAQTYTVRTYCAQCYNNCPVVAHVEGGRLRRVTPDADHPYARALCPKGAAAAELVYSPARLTHPLRRTRPKGSSDPGWERIPWDEALDTVASELLRIKTDRGPEAVAFTQSFVSTPLWEIQPYVRRLSNAFGSPNTVTTTHICNWHRDFGSALTFAQPRTGFAAGWPELEASESVLIWGCNSRATLPSLHVRIEKAKVRGAALVVVDPRRTRVAAMADLWLQPKPGTDGALALAMLHVLLEEDRFDDEFARNWTNAPLLVREDTGRLLEAKDVGVIEGAEGFVAVSDSGGLLPSLPGVLGSASTSLEASVTVSLEDGETVACRTVFDRFRESLRSYSPEVAATVTGVPAERIREAVEILAERRPVSWYSYNGIEQSANAVQTNRSLCVLYALIGDYDAPGGNTLWPTPPLVPPMGLEFVTPEMVSKTLGLRENPLGPSGTLMSVPAHAFYDAVLDEKPYPVVGLVGFGGNLVTSNAESLRGREALQKLEFQVHVDLFMTPTAEQADIVLPAASFWEVGRLGFQTDYTGREYILRWRPPIIAPREECRDDLEIILEIGKRLGMSDAFWHGDTEAAQACQLSRLERTLDEIREAEAEGGLRITTPMQFRKYKESGFRTPTGGVEVFSKALSDVGQAALPTWTDPEALFPAEDEDGPFPLTLTNAKLRHFCQSQHRGLPSLRRISPDPFGEVHPETAREHGIENADWMIVETSVGRVRVKAQVNGEILQGVVCVQHGWWQPCEELGLPGSDPFSADGANANLLFGSSVRDPVSGSVHLKGVPCRIRRAEVL